MAPQTNKPINDGDAFPNEADRFEAANTYFPAVGSTRTAAQAAADGAYTATDNKISLEQIVNFARAGGVGEDGNTIYFAFALADDAPDTPAGANKVGTINPNGTLTAPAGWQNTPPNPTAAMDVYVITSSPANAGDNLVWSAPAIFAFRQPPAGGGGGGGGATASFGAFPSIPTLTTGTAIAPITLPEASGLTTPTYTLRGLGASGLAFDANTRRITGTPTAAGDYALTYEATGDVGNVETTISHHLAIHIQHAAADSNTYALWQAGTDAPAALAGATTDEIPATGDQTFNLPAAGNSYLHLILLQPATTADFTAIFLGADRSLNQLGGFTKGATNANIGGEVLEFWYSNNQLHASALAGTSITLRR